MSYNSNYFIVARGAPNCEGSESAPVIHSYGANTANDTLATVLAANYFSSYFGKDSVEIKDGDYILVNATNGQTLLIITDALAGTVTETMLGDYESGVINTTWSGAFATPQAGVIRYVRAGKSVQLVMEQVTGAAANATTILCPVGTLPSSIDPGSQITSIPCVVIDNGAQVLGSFVLQFIDNRIEFSVGVSGAGTFATTASCGFGYTPVSWILP